MILWAIIFVIVWKIIDWLFYKIRSSKSNRGYHIYKRKFKLNRFLRRNWFVIVLILVIVFLVYPKFNNEDIGFNDINNSLFSSLNKNLIQKTFVKAGIPCKESLDEFFRIKQAHGASGIEFKITEYKTFLDQQESLNYLNNWQPLNINDVYNQISVESIKLYLELPDTDGLTIVMYRVEGTSGTAGGVFAGYCYNDIFFSPNIDKFIDPYYYLPKMLGGII